ncbi:MAG: DNA mismatch repair endonuclease MutL [Muribaculaceae bacterium]|nr:DNA mismatch repair endonuclease MutL [Muribaculaceae bacterium]
MKTDVIRLLPDSVANQIAAGEVIQRPASVLKELVENAVDAGATEIRVFVKDAGRTLLQVTDNGCGMSETDARMAFERHATSKISDAADLFSLSTMGFRGEALPSICAISEVEVLTGTGEEGTAGTRLVIRGSRVETQEPCAHMRGTSMSVRDLFFNVPARRKFLKSDSVELSNLMREFERLALVNNHIRMSIDTGSRRIDLRATTLKQRIHDIWKNNLNMQLVPVNVDTSLIRIEGFVSRPEFARRRNPLQFLIVNGRNMRHPYFHKAVMSCFEGLIAADTQPCYFLKFSVDPSTIDVNIHPTKNEIKFEYEQQIWPILVAAVKAALGKYAAVPSIDFDTDVVPVAPLHPGESPDAPALDISADYNPFTQPDVFETPRGMPGQVYEPSRRKERPAARGWENLYRDFMQQQSEGAPAPPAPEPLLPEEDASLPALCLQSGLKYIITVTREGVVVIDQHRAHVKVLYENCMRELSRQEGVSQRVMFPESIELDAARQAALAAVTADLSRLGFELEYDEERLWRITAVPGMLKGADPKDVVMRILDSVCEFSADYGADGAPAESMLSRAALLMARAAAIKGGRRLAEGEMEHLVGELFSLPDPSLTPDGHRVYALLTSDAIAGMLP